MSINEFEKDDVQVNGAFERLALGALVFEHPAQRVKNNATKLRAMEANWNPEGFGLPLISGDDENNYRVIDGRHRCTAALKLFGPDTEVVCEVFYGLTQQQEHDLFLSRNNQTVISMNDRYPNELGAGRATAVAVNEVLTRHGLKVGPVGSPDTVKSPGTLVKVFEREGEEILSDTVGTLLNSFGVAAIIPAFVDGLAQVFSLYDGQTKNLGPLNRKFMTIALANIKGANPWQSAVNTVKAAQAAKGGAAVQHAARFIVDAYNLYAKEVGEPPIPPWDRALVVQERVLAAVRAKAEAERREQLKKERAAQKAQDALRDDEDDDTDPDIEDDSEDSTAPARTVPGATFAGGADS